MNLEIHSSVKATRVPAKWSKLTFLELWKLIQGPWQSEQRLSKAYRLLSNLRFSNTPALRHQAPPPLREPGPSALIPSLLSARAFPEEAVLAGPLRFGLRSVTSPAPCPAQNHGLRLSQTPHCFPERSHASTPSRESPLQTSLKAASHHFPLQQCKL